MPTEWTDLQAENLQSEAKEAVLRKLRRELRQERTPLPLPLTTYPDPYPYPYP